LIFLSIEEDMVPLLSVAVKTSIPEIER
jgi:hypothetical protein